MMATAAGIGCFLAFIGLQRSEGLGIITFDGATLVTLGGCPPEEQVTLEEWGNIDTMGVSDLHGFIYVLRTWLMMTHLYSTILTTCCTCLHNAGP